MPDTKLIHQSTFDAWRVACFASVFFAALFSGVLIFQAENESAMRRCLDSTAEKAECRLIVMGR